MNPTRTDLHSTRLENLGIEPYGARFDLDGRTVQIRGDGRTPLVGALQEFHRLALGDFEAYQARPRPGWFSRLRSWVGRLLGGQAQGVSQAARPEPPAQPAIAAAPAPRIEKQAAAVGETGPAMAAAGRNRAAAATRGSEPVLRAVFADREGVHLVWQPASAKGGAKPVAMTYNLDSELAGRLQDCYGHLAELGYKVAGLELLRPEEGRRPKGGREPEKAEPAQAETPGAGREKAAAAPARPRVPRHRPEAAREADEGARAADREAAEAREKPALPEPG